MPEQTIAAVATPPGRGGVGMLRLSGPDALNIAMKMTRRDFFKPREACYCHFYDESDVLVDEGLLLFFKSPYSFTGEDVVEFHAHGSPVVLDWLLKSCVSYGARLAKPGEFSERAFLNDKIDLTQAEAIADLIQAGSETAARLAVRALQGDFSKTIRTLNDQLIHLRMYVEAAIDFPEEEIDFISDGKMVSKLEALITALDDIKARAGQGVIIREGLSVVIAGRPNAGKSTLINALSGREVAIVTDVAGTTRDVMREYVLLDDIPLHIIDTAGLRVSDDVVEKEGIKRAWEAVTQADCVLLVVDVTLDDHEQALLDDEIRNALPDSVPIIRVFNKIDVNAGASRCEGNHVFLSAKTGEGLEILKQRLKEIAGYQPLEGQFLARRRHMEALQAAYDLLLEGKQQLKSHRALELLAFDLNKAHQALGEITGEFTTNDLLGKIFSSFCIGK